MLAVERPVRLEASEPPEARGLTVTAFGCSSPTEWRLDRAPQVFRTCLDSSRPAT